MAHDFRQYRQRALVCASRAADSTTPAPKQKFADLAIVWMMLAAQSEDLDCRIPRESEREKDPNA
jgi:hypothetical protein